VLNNDQILSPQPSPKTPRVGEYANRGSILPPAGAEGPMKSLYQRLENGEGFWIGRNTHFISIACAFVSSMIDL
jgi:hypothetical protein